VADDEARAPAGHLKWLAPTSLLRIATETSTTPAGGRFKRRREDEFSAERRVYEPHRVGLPPLRSYFRELWRRREFAFEMARTAMRAQHLDTNFGRLWLLLNPLLLAFVYFLLDDILRRGNHPPHLLAHLIGCIFIYYFVSGSIRSGARTVTKGGRLVLNTAFPRMLLPLSSVLEHFLRFLPTVAIFVFVILIDSLPVGVETLAIIPLTLLFIGVAAGLSMLVAATQVYFRDLAQFLPYILRIWLYLTPILYYLTTVPEDYRIFVWLNPIGALMVGWSDVLINGDWPELKVFAIGGAWAIGLLLAGGLFFMSRERDFAVRL
jgi:teichoic acid transport system permease protein